MKSGRIAVVDYGMGNIHSILKALRMYHPDTIFTGKEEELKKADVLVLPGDGAFEAGMRNIRGVKTQILLDHVRAGKPLLGVCIGFQMLFTDSDETHGMAGPTIPGLGFIPGKIRKFNFADEKIRVPHMGWNNLVRTRGFLSSFGEPYVYFIHSYRPVDVPEQYAAACCDYAGDLFPAAVEKESVFAVQFHPEKSDRTGLSMIERWLESI